MRVIETRNAHQALALGIDMLQRTGVQRASRNGAVVMSNTPVTTRYERPWEKVVFWPQRDYNIAFCLYEALWMLAGRNDVAPLTRYVKTFDRYSNDKQTLHAAYGHRWRKAFGFDQLEVIANRLRENPDDRRCVLQIWDAKSDLNPTDTQLDIPCNDTVTFQRGVAGELNMVVFNRSNDIVWGAYFANAFQFGMLLEYMAHWIGCPIGTYSQISVNYHAYKDVLDGVAGIPRQAFSTVYASPAVISDPYADGRMTCRMMTDAGSQFRLDELITQLLDDADNGFDGNDDGPEEPWARAIWAVLRAHHIWRVTPKPEGFSAAITALGQACQANNDWVLAMKNWLTVRAAAWDKKMRADGRDTVQA